MCLEFESRKKAEISDSDECSVGKFFEKLVPAFMANKCVVQLKLSCLHYKYSDVALNFSREKGKVKKFWPGKNSSKTYVRSHLNFLFVLR